ncbi:uncharacterized protein LOC126375548 [Pectinophora gossypiella]|uniref:uncharacterized protein LOC126375548 n=1 Tax=Pectinophora gossypiella TaxID=13191 RepID=UPI00214E4564|nr:uncharacterized protein LOC126375548 [Pectinophora gossypiella]
MDYLKQKSSSNFESIQKQYEKVVHDLKDNGIHFLADIPKFNSIKTGLYNERNKVLGVSKSRFQHCRDAEIPSKFKRFLLAEYVDDDYRIIVFCTNENRRKLSYYYHFYADGTFKSCPKGFKQLYSIHGYNKQSQSVDPLLFALLPDKKQKTYEILCYLIKATLPSWRPIKITLDFEVAAINAFQNVFPKIIFKGCYFHFNRCLWRKAKDYNIKLRTEKRHVARCVGLARLPIQYIEDGYDYVMNRSPNGEGINKFNMYFKKQWMKNNQMLDTCSCSNEKIRTNNNIEGWHGKINKYIGRKYPSLSQLLECLETDSGSLASESWH